PIMLGDVISGKAEGRVTDTAISIFDSSGIAVQDLFLGQHLIEAAEAAGCTIEL
ncbi:MAG: ornithine cyclodeaminase, partial [Moritella sp.]